MPSLWRNRDFWLLWSGQVVSTLGSTASSIVYPLLILALTESAQAAGIASALRALPYIVFSLPVGALVDRWDRRRVMILCDVGRALAVATIPVAMFLGVLTLVQIYVVSLIEGSLFVFFNLAEVAALPRVVPREQLPQATAQNEAAFGTASIIGPSIGTVLYQALGRGAPFAANALSYLVSAVSLVFIKTRFQSDVRPVPRKLHLEIAEGLNWLWRAPLIRYIALLTGGLNLVNSAAPLVLIVLAKHMGVPDAEIGLVFSAAGVGAVAGSLIGGSIQRRFRFGQVIIAVIWIEALLFSMFLLTDSFVLLALVNGLFAITAPIYNVVQFSYRIALIPDALQGRVNSTFRLLAFGFNPLGAALSGVIIEQFGVRAAVATFAVLFVILAVATTANRHVREAPALSSPSL